MKKPTKRQVYVRRRVVISMTMFLVFGMGSLTQKKVYEKRYQPPTIALAQNKDSKILDEMQLGKSIDNTAYVNERAYKMYMDFEIRTLEVNGQELVISHDKYLPKDVRVEEAVISGNRVRIIIED